VLHAGGLTATLRKSRGVDILAACGQLNSEWTAGGAAASACKKYFGPLTSE